MICPNCGANVNPGTKFCVNCGATLTNPTPQNLVPVNPAASDLTPSNVLKWGILGAAFACTFVVSFLGIIFGAIGLKKANSYLAVYGPGAKQVKIGHILSKVGIIAGSILSVLFIIYIVYIIVMVSSYSYYY